MALKGSPGKRTESLKKEIASRIATIERLRKERKAEELRKAIERQRLKKDAAENTIKAYSDNFRLLRKPELLEKKSMYQRMKRIAEGNKNEVLVHHCEDMLKGINELLKERK